VDPSDVVQDTLAEASQRLPNYVRQRPVSFYPWLRQIAWQRIVDLLRRHIHARRRSIDLEEERVLELPDESAIQLADRLSDNETSPSGQLLREERRAQVRAALDKLHAREREVLVLVYLEQLKAREASEVLGISEGALNMRHLRAIRRLRSLLRRE
jgi:RNA polymerase sigma-70 factor (ECF subfamily)